MDDEDMHDDMDEYEKGVKGKGKEKGKGKGKGMDYMDDDSDDERAQIESQLNWGGDEVIPEDVDAEEWEKSGQNSTTVLTGIKDVDGSVAAIDGSDTHTYVPGRGKGPPKQFEMAQQQLLKQQEDVSKKTSVPPPPSSPLPSGGYQKGKGGKKSKRKTKKRKSKSKKRKSKKRKSKRKTRSNRKKRKSNRKKGKSNRKNKR